MRRPISIALMALACSCHSEGPCTQAGAMKIAVAQAKAHPIVAYDPAADVAAAIDGPDYKIGFSKKAPGIGGGMTVWINRSTCKVTKSMFGQ